MKTIACAAGIALPISVVLLVVALRLDIASTAIFAPGHWFASTLGASNRIAIQASVVFWWAFTSGVVFFAWHYARGVPSVRL